MRYWDASAIVPLLVAEETSNRMDLLVQEDTAIVTWWGTTVECTSAVARLERDGILTGGDVRAALERLRVASQTWIEVPATTDVREQAIRLLRVHRLRATDALQLAAAIVASDFQASAIEFVTLDERQAAAAEREGFTLS